MRKHPWRTLLRHPVVLFLVFGAALYLLAPSPRSDDDIELSADVIEALQAAEARRQGTPLTEAERAKITALIVEEEVLVREARRLGLDQSDAIVRRRLVQKMRLLAEQLDGVDQPPTEAEVRGWYEQTRDRWQTGAQYGFVHVFAQTDRRAVLDALGPETLTPGDDDRPPAAGDPFPLSRRVALTDDDELSNVFGDDLVGALAALPLGSWSEPIRSRYGWHRVKVLERRDPRPASLSEVRAQVAMELTAQRRQAAVERLLSQAYPRYTITVAGRPYEGGPAERSAPVFDARVAGLETP